MKDCDTLIIGGGAAGVFAAIAAKQAVPSACVAILESSSHLLAKVRLSGGGRCNVTNACSPLSTFVQRYPRGSKELHGPLHRFGPQETVEWFESHGVRLKSEADGRIFPTTNSSETIISCLTSELKARDVTVSYNARIRSIAKGADSLFHVVLEDDSPQTTRFLLLATGSSPSGYALAASFGHTLAPPVPALFALAVPSSTLAAMSGLSVNPVEASLVGSGLSQQGSILITHGGFSGPAILKLSSWGARYLHERDYKAELSINWLPDMSAEAIFRQLAEWKRTSPNTLLSAHPLFPLPKRLWRALAGDATSSLSHKDLRQIAQRIHDSRFSVDGCAPNKEEFVTCGGVHLKEICWKTMESVLCPGLFFAGEILDVDGLTGGFNLQNAWTTGWIAGNSMRQK